MHDVEPDPRKRMPPLIVIGLTGPVGSGCSTLSKLFDIAGKDRMTGNNLSRILEERDKSIAINHSNS